MISKFFAMNSPFTDFLIHHTKAESFNRLSDEILEASPLKDPDTLDFKIEQEEGFGPNYREREYAEKELEHRLSENEEVHESYDNEWNSYDDEIDIEPADEASVIENKGWDEGESEYSLNMDYLLPKDRLAELNSKYIPLLDAQKTKDKYQLTDFIFWDIHADLLKQRKEKKLFKSDPENLKQEWKDILNQIVLPYLLLRAGLPANIPLSMNIPLGTKQERRGVALKSVHYLALEGGGGRGAVYLGAIKALEEQGILPIRPGGQIRGLSGSSAGAISCFLLSLGYTSDQIQKELFPRSGQSITENFINDIKPGCFRMVTKDFKSFYRTPRESEVYKNFKNADLAHIENIFESFKWKHPVIASLLPRQVEDLRKSLPILIFSSLDYLMVKIVQMGVEVIGNKLHKLNMGAKIPSIYNLLHDGGYFTGLGVRQALETWFNTYNARKDNPYDSNINFEQFYKLTGVDLKITGTNITQGYGAFFSKATTPEFPVIEAIGISGCFPFVFKPIWVDSQKPIRDGIQIYDSRLADYDKSGSGYKTKTLFGFWADGGIANNLPLHAFDEAAGILNNKVLALRLTPPKGNGVTLDQMTMPSTVKNYTMDYYGSLSSMLTNASEESQIRTGEEVNQTIDLDTGTLKTTAFTSDFSVWKPFSDLARIKVNNYFRHNKI